MKPDVIDQVDKNRLKWNCRRGLLELDLVLERFLGRDENLQKSVVASLNEILELPDNDLWDIVIGRSDRYAPHLNEIVARLRAA
jgi:succinate dehydrogenase flavin-adding protein (antitoxin of CptAB toxin-antitoxin module)